jgi:hypothetical protein
MPVMLEQILWFTSPLLFAVMSVSMVRRGLHREVPWFFAYTLFDGSLTAFSWFLRNNTKAYFYYYWIMEVLGVILAFVIIYEVFRKIVVRYERVQRVGFALYRWSAVALLLVGTVTVAIAPEMNRDALFDGIMTLQVGVRIIQTGLLVFLFAFASYLGLSWRNCSFGVALGFGFLAIVELTLAALHAQFGADFIPVYTLLKPIAFLITVLIWAGYVLQRQPVLKQVTSVPKTEVAVWNDTLTEFMRR